MKAPSAPVAPGTQLVVRPGRTLKCPSQKRVSVP
jgi:hypothetical protein